MTHSLVLFVLVGIIGLVGDGTFLRGQPSPIPVPVPTSHQMDVTPTPAVARPIRLTISALDVDAPIEPVGLDAQKRMAVPSRDELVGWYSLGVVPGQRGSAVLAGHFDAVTGLPAVFYRLDELLPGDEVVITDADQRAWTFEVLTTEIFPDAAFPIPLVFEQADQPRLNLITCDGVFDQAAANYTDRLVVFTRLKV